MILSPVLPSPAVFVVHRRLGDKNGCEKQDRRESREGRQVASGKRGTCQTVFSFLVWRDTGAAPKQTVRARLRAHTRLRLEQRKRTSPGKVEWLCEARFRPAGGKLLEKDNELA